MVIAFCTALLEVFLLKLTIQMLGFFSFRVPNAWQILLTLKMPEDQYTEWKETWSDDYFKWVSAFANTEGGVLHIGRNDKGVVIGLPKAKKLMEDIPNKSRDFLGILVDVHFKEDAGKEYLEIEVEPYPVPVSFRGQYFIRSGSTKQELKGAALVRFLLRKQGKHWDGIPVSGLSLDMLSVEAVESFKARAIKSGRMDTMVLEDELPVFVDNLNLLDQGNLVQAAALLFTKNPEKWVHGSYVKIGFFESDDDLRYQDEIHGNIFDQVDRTLELLHSKYLKAYISYEGVQRIETFLFPYDALREALMNAVVHKDYSSGTPIQISVYDDRLVIWGSGQLPEGWTLDFLQEKHPSKPFNPLLAGAFFRTGYIESWGRGIEKINKGCVVHDIDPAIFDFRMSGLMVTFNANPAHLPKEVLLKAEGGMSVGASGKLSPVDSESTREENLGTREETQSSRGKILRQILANPEITMDGLAEELGISSKGVEWQISRLKALKLLNRMGSTKKGYWIVEADVSEFIKEGSVKNVKAPVSALGTVSAKVTVKRSEKTRGETRVKRGRKILDQIRNNPEISMTQIAAELEMTAKGVEWQITQLKKSGVIERVGPANGGHWKVNEREES